jgi:hypothetical protein
MIRGCIRENGFDQVGVLFDPCPDVEVDNISYVLFRQRHLVSLHYRGQVQGYINSPHVLRARESCLDHLTLPLVDRRRRVAPDRGAPISSA